MVEPTQSNSEGKLLSTTDPKNFTLHKFQSEPWWKATRLRREMVLHEPLLNVMGIKYWLNKCLSKYAFCSPVWCWFGSQIAHSCLLTGGSFIDKLVSPRSFKTSLSDSRVICVDRGGTGTFREESCLLLLPRARCCRGCVWCPPFAWSGTYLVSIRNTAAPTHTAHEMTQISDHTPHPYLLWNRTGRENSQSHIPLHIKVDKRMKGFVNKLFKQRITANCS